MGGEKGEDDLTPRQRAIANAYNEGSSPSVIAATGIRNASVFPDPVPVATSVPNPAAIRVIAAAWCANKRLTCGKAAAISSGSFLTAGMVVMPCSMKTLASIATGVGLDLVARAADVTLKERRPLVLVTRETPLNLIHIRNMETVTLAGATVLPPMPAFYHQPASIEDLLRQTAGKVLDQFGIEHKAFERWA